MKIDALVERALQTWEVTRSSDRKLIMAVWWLQDNEYHAHFKDFFMNEAVMPETITRCRRKLQEQGKYPATKEVDEARFNKFKEMRYNAPHSNVAEIAKALFKD